MLCIRKCPKLLGLQGWGSLCPLAHFTDWETEGQRVAQAYTDLYHARGTPDPRHPGLTPLHQVPPLIFFTGQFISSYLKERSGYGDVECGFLLPLKLKLVLTSQKRAGEGAEMP